MNDTESGSAAVASSEPSVTVAAVPGPLSRAEREAMMKEAAGVVRAFVVKSAIHPGQKDDAVQDVMLKLWEKTERFDPSRGVKWTTYAVGVTRRTITRILSEAAKEPSPAQAEEGRLEKEPDRGEGVHGAGQCEDGGEDCECEDRESELAGAMREAIRLKLSEPLLGRLTPKIRQLVEMVAFEGLTPDQVSIRLGYPVKVIKINLQAAVRRMLGQVNRGSKADTERAAARELLAELAAANPTWTAKRLHSELAEFIPISVANRMIQQMKKAGPLGAGVRNESATMAMAG